MAIAASAAWMARRSPDAAPVARIEHLVGHRESVGEGRLLVGDAEEVLVGDDDQRVDAGLELLYPGVGDALAPCPFELEGLGDDADGEDALLAGGAGDDRCRTGAGAAAHAGGDEHHVRAVQVVDQLVDRLLGGGAADLGLRAGAEALGDGDAHLHLALGLRRHEGLAVGVGDDELAAEQAGADHVVDGIAAGAAHAEHRDLRLQLPDIRHLQIDRHGTLIVLTDTAARVPPASSCFRPDAAAADVRHVTRVKSSP